LAAYLLLKRLRSRYGRKPIYTDGALWYPEACRWLRLKHHIYGDESKNLAERMKSQEQNRVLRSLLPYFKEECDMEHVHNWMRLFPFYITRR